MATTRNGQVAVFGLREAVNGLKTVGLEKVASDVNREVAKSVEGEARSRLQQQPVPKTRSVIGRRQSRTAAAVVLRYSRFPWAAGAEFGAIAYPQFRPWVGNKYTKRSTPGYMIGSTLRDELPQIEKTYRRRLLKAIDDATK